MNNAPANDVTDTAAAFARENARLAKLAEGHWQGAKYVSGREPREIARLIREEIKSEVKAGRLPSWLRVGVRSEWSGHAKSIDITVKGAPTFELWSTARARFDARPARETYGVTPPAMLTQAARDIVAAVEAVANRFGYDKSDLVTDYHNSAFFLSVDFDGALRTASRERVEGIVRAAYGVAS